MYILHILILKRTLTTFYLFIYFLTSQFSWALLQHSLHGINVIRYIYQHMIFHFSNSCLKIVEEKVFLVISFSTVWKCVKSVARKPEGIFMRKLLPCCEHSRWDTVEPARPFLLSKSVIVDSFTRSQKFLDFKPCSLTWKVHCWVCETLQVQLCIAHGVLAVWIV